MRWYEIIEKKALKDIKEDTVLEYGDILWE